MTDTPIPASLDCRKAFVRRAEIQGTVPVTALARFSALLVEPVGQVSVAMHFDLDDSYRKVITGSVRVLATVACQRCLEPLDVLIHEPLNLAVVESEGLAQRLPTELDAWITEDPMLSLHDMVEEQLILGMPIVAAHPEGECEPALASGAAIRFLGTHDPGGTEAEGPGTGSRESDRQSSNPFAALKVLKTGGTDKSGTKN